MKSLVRPLPGTGSSGSVVFLNEDGMAVSATLNLDSYELSLPFVSMEIWEATGANLEIPRSCASILEDGPLRTWTLQGKLEQRARVHHKVTVLTGYKRRNGTPRIRTGSMLPVPAKHRGKNPDFSHVPPARTSVTTDPAAAELQLLIEQQRADAGCYELEASREIAEVFDGSTGEVSLKVTWDVEEREADGLTEDERIMRGALEENDTDWNERNNRTERNSVLARMRSVAKAAMDAERKIKAAGSSRRTDAEFLCDLTDDPRVWRIVKGKLVSWTTHAIYREFIAKVRTETGRRNYGIWNHGWILARTGNGDDQISRKEIIWAIITTQRNVAFRQARNDVKRANNRRLSDDAFRDAVNKIAHKLIDAFAGKIKDLAKNPLRDERECWVQGATTVRSLMRRKWAAITARTWDNLATLKGVKLMNSHGILRHGANKGRKGYAGLLRQFETELAELPELERQAYVDNATDDADLIRRRCQVLAARMNESLNSIARMSLGDAEARIYGEGNPVKMTKYDKLRGRTRTQTGSVPNQPGTVVFPGGLGSLVLGITGTVAKPTDTPRGTRLPRHRRAHIRGRSEKEKLDAKNGNE